MEDEVTGKIRIITPRKMHGERQYRCACDLAALPMYTNLQKGRKEGKREGRKAHVADIEW